MGRGREELSGPEVFLWVGGNVLDLVSGDFQTNTESPTHHRKLHYKIALWFPFFLSTFIYLPLGQDELGHVAHVWRSEDNLLVLSLYH